MKAFQDRKRGKSPETVAVKSLSDITINLIDCSVTERNELALAFRDIDSPATVDLIRECPIGGHLFWAGRADKEACNRHAQQWRKTKQRRREKLNKAEIKREREAANLTKTAKRLSKTAVAVITAIMARHCRVFHNIDQEASYEIGISWERVPSSFIVRQTLTMLVKRGYLDYRPHGNRLEDYYEPEDALTDLWREIQRLWWNPTH